MTADRGTPRPAGRGEVISAHLPAALVLLAVPFLRPNIFGESWSAIGFLLMCAGATLSLLRPQTEDAHLPTRRPGGDAVTGLVLCLGLAYLWLLIRSAATDPTTEAQPALQGMVLTVGSLLALAVVCRERRARLMVARWFVYAMAALSGSYLVTALLWTGLGVGAGQVTTIFFDQWGSQPVYFPFTTTVSTQTVLGIRLPRFSGIGREPGWMAMYCAIAYFLADMVCQRTRRLKILLVIGVLGTISTAGFGVFVVAWAYHTFLRARGGINLRSYLRQIAGIGAMALALWLATDAPILGLSAKETQNATSLDERRLATEAGIRALFEAPLGGPMTEAQGGINLISDIAVSGLPFVLLVCLALLLPVLLGNSSQFGNSVVVVVFLTMLTSQPAKDSTWAFGLVLLAAACSRDGPGPPDPEPPANRQAAAGTGNDLRGVEHERT